MARPASTSIGIVAIAGLGVLLAGLELARRQAWRPREGVVAVGALALFAMLCALTLGLRPGFAERRRLGGIRLRDLDRMSGAEFERWVHARLERAGFAVVATPRSRDFGVDLLVETRGVRVGIEVKRLGEKVSNAVVRSVVAGAQHHGCDAACVVTQASFTSEARRQAARAPIPVGLIGRRRLVRLRRCLMDLARPPL